MPCLPRPLPIPDPFGGGPAEYRACRDALAQFDEFRMRRGQLPAVLLKQRLVVIHDHALRIGGDAEGIPFIP